MNPALFIVGAKQIQILRGCCYNTARKELRTVKDSVGATQLTVRQLAIHWDIPIQEIASALSIKMK
jgi:hypothetical protein